MIEFRNVKVSKNITEDDSGYSYVYFEDDLGRDWYDVRDREWGGINKFIATDVNGYVVTSSENPNFLTLAEGMSIYEVLEYPDDIVTTGYKYENGNFISQGSKPSELAKREKTRLIDESSSKISILQDAVDLGMANEEEANSLLEWKKYRLLLSRVDIDEPAWPKKPAS